jgi:hypothetical protein
VGRVLAKLDELKLANDTIVLYFSDNGPNSWRWNGGMKGRKGSVDEGGVREPFMIRWPGHIKGGTKVPQIAGAIDLLPTLTDMAGIPVASTKPLDGKSIKPLLLGQAGEWPDRMIFTLQNKKISVRTQQYRFIDTGELFDMQADPCQDRNVAKEKPEVAAKLGGALAAWAKEMLPLVGKDDRPFPVGYAETTWLPARDGVPEGGIERSASAPNCSYFTNWKSKSDQMTWDIELGSGGDFEPVIYYTCPAGDVGSTVELSFMGVRTECKITEAYDPPLMGKQYDRVERAGESYWKEFRQLPAGKMTLPKGRGKLTLKALDIPGKQVGDVRYVAMIRK